MMILRIISSIILLFSIIFMPFYVSVILAFLAMVYFQMFYEALILFFLSDLLFGSRMIVAHSLIFNSFLFAFLMLIIIEALKKKLKFYK